MPNSIAARKISIIGLGYVGLPLAVVLSRHVDVVGFDVSARRVAELASGRDGSNEVTPEALAACAAVFTTDPSPLADCDVHIVTVPTPVDEENNPDLTAVLAACATVGAHLKKGAIVVFESTVYPGTTESVCGPALEAASGMKCGTDFFLGYSPERINPGDKVHSVDKITKVVAGQTADVTAVLERLYGVVVNGNIFVARDIRTAEAAKVMENAQRDINIAFINEMAMIFDAAGLSTYDVLAAAETKWNFLPFKPGLVGGHCIGVDPYYLADLAHRLGREAEVILTGRRINEAMPAFVADRVHDKLGGKPSRLLMLGLTFKENVPDLRNSKAADLVRHLTDLGHEVLVHDACASAEEASELYGIRLLDAVADAGRCDGIVGAVRHDAYAGFAVDDLMPLLNQGGVVADLKGMWRGLDFPGHIKRWNL